MPKTYPEERKYHQQIHGAGKPDAHVQRDGTIHHLAQKLTPNRSKPNVKPQTLKLLEENIGSVYPLQDFLNSSPFAQELRLIIEKWDFIKPKSFRGSKETVSWVKRKPTENRMEKNAERVRWLNNNKGV